MEKYDQIAVVGEGSYGMVMKCRHRETGQMVAIKKFLETEEDNTVRKMALREIRMLKKLRHENLVNMIEVFRRKRRFYLVFEYMDHTVLDELEENTSGLGEDKSRQHIFQVIRGIDFCHNNNIVHRDVKPENVLVSRLGVIKLCDFGFARLLATPGETCTDYVATRWYRAPELLVGDTKYGREVDIWAIGCLFAEMMCGDPLFPGESDIDQLFQIVKLLGKLSHRHQQLVARNPMFKGLKRSPEEGPRSLYKLFPNWSHLAMDFLSMCLKLDPSQRPTSMELLKQPYITHDLFPERFLPELRAKIQQEFQGNPLLRKFQSAVFMGSAARRTRDRGSDSGDIKAGLQHRRSYMEPPRWKINLMPSENNINNCDNRKLIMDLTKPVPITTRRKMSDGTSMMDVAQEDQGSKPKVPVMFGEDPLNVEPPSSSPAPFQSLQVQSSNYMQTPNYLTTMSVSGLIPSVPGEHQHTSFPTPGPPSSMQVLHPSINNLSFNAREGGQFQTKHIEPLKRSPLPPNNRLKDPVPLPPRTQMVRRLERGLVLDVAQQSILGSESPCSDRWFSNRRLGMGTGPGAAVWRTPKPLSDDFSLPNVPGASCSPSKGVKKKLNPVTPHSSMDPFISPTYEGQKRTASATRPKKRLRATVELPHLGN